MPESTNASTKGADAHGLGARRVVAHCVQGVSGGRAAYHVDDPAHYRQRHQARVVEPPQPPNGYTSGFAGITTTNSYNKLLQPAILSAAAPSQTVFSLSYDFHLGAGDNGNVFGITNGRDSFRPLVGSATYGYDSLNRLQSASTTGTDCTMVNGFSKNWGESFNVDPWSNLLSITPTKCSAENLQVSVTPTSGPSKNQIITTGYSYDAAGNMTLDGQGHAPVYDGENRIKTVGTVNYTYDGDGERVKKDSGKLYWTGTGSDPLTETDLSGNPTADYVFFNGKRIARVDLAGGAVHYYFSDHLGSASVVTNATGTTIEQESDYYPYGGERVITAGANNYKFTGKERDAESGLDDSDARYYESSTGRFMSPDWADRPNAVPYAILGDPQSLNLYSYVSNNPLARTDPDGHDCFSSGNGSETRCSATTDDKTPAVQANAEAAATAAQNSGWSLSWQVHASANFLVGELQGVADVTVTPVVNAVEHPIATVEGLANAVEHPVDTAKAMVNGAVDTAKAAANGDPRAFGQVVGTAATVAYAAENVKIRAYENTGGGGINFKNTPTAGSSIRFDVHPLEQGGAYKPHVDITIKKPGVPSGPGSNLIKPIHHWPWE